MAEQPQDRTRTLGTSRPQSESVDRKLDDTSREFSLASEAGSFESQGTRIDHFLLTQRLGEGGFGTVWHAEQTEPIQRSVALKVLKAGMDSQEIIARFAQERQALAVMDHPGIAKVLDAGLTSQGRPYFVMELVNGLPLNAYCDRNQLGMTSRLDLFVQICLAVQHAHQKGVIHRDLKSSNILVTDTPDGPQPKIIDFGIAKAIAQPLTDASLRTLTGQFIGTPAYMSPEQASGLAHDLDTRSDVYSLGVVLYQLLTGCLPFDSVDLRRGNPDELRRQIVDAIPARPSTRLKGLPNPDQVKMAMARRIEFPRLLQMVRGDLDWIIMKALEKDRSRRYATASDFAADVRRYLHREPVVARPPSFGYVLQRFIARHRGAVAVGGALLAMLVLGLAFSTTMFFRERSARANAESSAVKSGQVAKLLKDMLASAGPSIAQGKDATLLKEILDATATRLSKELTDQPDVESELRSILGETYEDLGEFEKARDQHQVSLQLRRQTLSPTDPLIAESLYGLASSLDYLDDLAGAEQALLELIAIEKRRTPPDAFRIANARDLLAWLLYRVGDVEAAEDECRAAVDIFRLAGEQKRDALAMGINTLGSILLKAGKFAQSEAAHREAIEIYRQTNGPLHPKVVTATNNLCHTLVKIGAFEEVERTALDALALEEKITGKKVNQCTDSLHKALAEVYAARGDLDAAVAELQVAVQAATEMYGPNHRFTNDKRSLLAQMQVRAGQLEAAQTTVDDARRAGGGASAEHSLEVATAKLALARGELDLAEQSARAALTASRQASRAPSLDMVNALQTLANVLAAKNEPREAESLLREAIAIVRPDLNPNCPMLMSLQSDLSKLPSAAMGHGDAQL